VVNKRSKLEIYLDVLKAIRKGTNKPTRIMYRTNLSWKILMGILDSLVQQEFIAVETQGRHKVYNVTEKGKNVLEYFKEAFQLVTIQ
jgi:predicted transcriptional regulator